MTLRIILFLTGILISGVAAFYSIVGLTAIFAGAFWPIVIMGSVLEIGKLVAVSWLYHSWKLCPFLLKSYLCMAIAILMLITSMGVFGFLSKAHLEQQLTHVGVPEQIQIIDARMSIHTETIRDIDSQIAQIDTAISQLKAQASLRAADQQRKIRSEMLSRKQDELIKQNELKFQKIKLETETKKIEAEVGPIKYVAEAIFGSSDSKVVDKAIRFVIVLLIIVFDPLAVLLLVAFNISLKNRKYEDIEFFDLSSVAPPPIKTKQRKQEPSATLPI